MTSQKNFIETLQDMPSKWTLPIFCFQAAIGGGHSLIEFEQLEEAVQLNAAAAEGDDLIGAYLQNLQQQEAREEEAGGTSRSESSFYKVGDQLISFRESADSLSFRWGTMTLTFDLHFMSFNHFEF